MKENVRKALMERLVNDRTSLQRWNQELRIVETRRTECRERIDVLEASVRDFEEALQEETVAA